MVSQRDHEEFRRLIEASSLGTPEAKRLRSLHTDEDMERFRKRLARRKEFPGRWYALYPLIISIMWGASTVLSVILGDVDSVVLGTIAVVLLIAASVRAYRFPQDPSGTTYFLIVLAFMIAAIEAFIDGSLFRVGLLAVASIATLWLAILARKTNGRK